MTPILPTLYSEPKYYRVSNEGIITEKDTWEQIKVLPEGLFYLERYVVKYEIFYGNWHIDFNFKILNKEKNDY